MHPAQLSLEDLEAECQMRSDRRGGPGGQHRNKVQTAMVISHKPTGCVAEASERRSQVDNRRVALFRLRIALALEVRTSRPDGGLVEPSQLWRRRARGNRLGVAPVHDDFPAILAELLDALHVCEYDVGQVSKHYSTTGSQLIRLLRSCPPALTAVNAQRLGRGLHKLT